MNTYQGEKANDDAYDTGTTAVERKDRFWLISIL